MEETLGSTNTLTKRQWIAEQAREHPERVFTSLHHLIDVDWMLEAYRRTRKDAAAGIDGVTAADYEKDLQAHLEDLLERIKSGRYVAPPVRRHFIPKPDGTKRPLGIPTFEDKVAQRAIVMLLEPIYEADFLPSSYGFRSGRSAHDALDALRTGIMEQKLRWVIDADLRKYFDSIPHSHLRCFLDLRIKDGVVRRMLDKWLNAGVLDKGVLQRSETGTPQGGVVSPLLSNVFLHYVLDGWFEAEDMGTSWLWEPEPLEVLFCKDLDKDEVPITLAGSGACEHREQLVLHTLEPALPEAGRAPFVERIQLVGQIRPRIRLGGLQACVPKPE